MFCALTTTGDGRLVVQVGDWPRFGVDWRLKPAELVGHDNVRYGAKRLMVSCGGVTGKVRLNTVPKPKEPPPAVVPYRVLPDKTRPPVGEDPPALVCQTG